MRIRRELKTAVAIGLLLCSAASFAVDAKASKYYEDALQRYERKDMVGAILQLKNALQIDKTILSAQLLLGKALLANSEPAAAEVALLEAQRLGVSRAEVLVPLAQALIAQGKHSQVLEQTRFRPEGLPAGVQAQLLLTQASAAADRGETGNALKLLMEARAIDPGSPDSWLAEVPIRLRARALPEALAAAERALKIAPNSGPALYQRGTIAHAQGELRTALDYYSRALQADEGDLESRLARAGIYLDLDRPKEARTDVDAALGLVPNEPRATYLLALLAERSGAAAEAKAALRAVTDMVDPVPVDFIRYRPQLLVLNGLAHFALEEPAKAKPYLELAQRQMGMGPVAKLLGQIYLQDREFDKAADALEGYVRAQPGDGQALAMLASVYVTQGRQAKAINLMQEALRSHDSPQFRTVLGLGLIRAGRPDTAVTELQAAFKRDPQQTQAGTTLALLHLRARQPAQAIPVLEQLLKTRPTDSSLQLLMGLAQQAKGNYPAARRAYEAAAKQTPEASDIKLALANLDLLERKIDSAQARLNAIMKTERDHVGAAMAMAAAYELKGAPDEASRWLKRAVDSSSGKETRADFALVSWYMNRKDYPAALEAAKHLLSKMPEDAAALMLYAQAQMASGDAAGGKATLSSAARRAGFNQGMLADIAALQLSLNDLPNARYSLEKALNGQPDAPRATALSARLELQAGNLKQAELHARRLQSLPGGQQDALLLLADIATARGQPSAAVDALRQAHEAAPTSASMTRLLKAMSAANDRTRAHQLAEQWLHSRPADTQVRRALADSQAQAGQFKAARSLYEQVVQSNPNDAEALNNLANVLIALQDAGALPLAERAVRLAPGNAIYMDTAGWAAFVGGDQAKALQLLRDARLRAPDNPAIRYHLAAALARSGRRDEARMELKMALAQGRDFEGADEANRLMQTLGAPK